MMKWFPEFMVSCLKIILVVKGMFSKVSNASKFALYNWSVLKKPKKGHTWMDLQMVTDQRIVWRQVYFKRQF